MKGLFFSMGEKHFETKPYQILLAVGVCVLDFAVGPGYLYWKSQTGTLLRVKDAAGNLLPILWQSMIPFLTPAFLLLLFAILLKKDFASRMYFTVKGRWQRWAVMVLGIAILGMTVYCLIVKQDKVAVLASLPYYLIFVAFAEEFVVRDVCTDLLRGYKWPVRYLVPNTCFACMHVFAYAEWRTVTGSYLLHFTASSMLGLLFGGCALQLLKEKSGTIWIPVLWHALMDYSVVLTY